MSRTPNVPVPTPHGDQHQSTQQRVTQPIKAEKCQVLSLRAKGKSKVSVWAQLQWTGNGLRLLTLPSLTSSCIPSPFFHSFRFPQDYDVQATLRILFFRYKFS
jgi:hypothetical protein